MKRLINTIVFAFLFGIYAQAQFFDDFSRGTFRTNPIWDGDTIAYTINSSNQLQLNSAGTASPYLSTNFTYNTTAKVSEWQFFIRLNFAPSASNYARVYLMSDNPDLNAPLNGYYLRFGENLALDAIELYRQQGTTVTRILRGTDATIANPFQAVVKVIRDANGEWTLFTDFSLQGLFTQEAQAVDATVTSMQHLGVVCFHTTTNRTNFFFDDFYAGEERTDVDAPILQSVRPIANNTLSLTFDEPLERSTAQSLSNYQVNNGIGFPTQAVLTLNPRVVELVFATNFVNRQAYNLTLQFIEDLSGNAMPRTIVPFSYFVPSLGDVIINEIFPDPTPVVGLPEQEFVELFNRTNLPIDLSGWTFKDPGATAILPSFVLQAGAHVILCPQSVVSQFQGFGPVIGLSPWPTLNNSGDELTITNDLNETIDVVAYSDTWYRSTSKRDGGWTLERIDPDNFCSQADNWIASVDASGGTPGRQNSVFGANPDTTPPAISSFTLISNNQVRLVFSERLEPISVTTAQFNINLGIGMPSAAVLEPSGRREVTLTFANNFVIGVVYNLTITAIADCAGNPMSSNTISLGIPEPILPNDIVINELLAAPRTGSSRFLEIYNRSNKIIDLQFLNIAIANANNEIDRTYTIINTPHLMKPGTYRVITNNSANILSNYQVPNPQDILQITTFPTYPAAGGRAVIHLRDSLQTRIDQFNYNENMHFRLIDDRRGISLERIDPNQPTNNASNWFSAAATVGYATPTYENSQRNNLQLETDKLTIEPSTFSPNGDGYNDLLFIKYNLGVPGFVGTCQVYDASGRLVKTLFRSETLAPNGVYTWDGVMENGIKARIGAYILYFEAFDLTGRREVFKKGFVIGGLN